MSLELQLKSEINKALMLCCPRSLPDLNRHIQDPEAKEAVASQILEICKSDGISVQAAMAQIDSEL